MSESTPSQLPPSNLIKTSEREARPPELSSEQLSQIARKGTAAAATTSVASAAAPSLSPSEAVPRVGAVGTTWQSNAQVSALWSINQDRNSWVYITNVQNPGWQKLSTASESAVVAMTMLGAHLKQTQTIINYRTEADGMIHEMYVW
jgi:hypothetical protein